MRRSPHHGALRKPHVSELGLNDLAAVDRLCQTPLARLEAYAAETERYYGQFEVPKGSGGVRIIRPPYRPLRDIQRRILDLLAHHTMWPPHLHGAVPRKSILTNASVHVGRQMVANLDVKSFFPSIELEAVRAILAGFGIAEKPVELLASLVTCPGEDGTRCLPQGAPTSPYFANHALASSDERFLAFCKARRLRYTRYIDDLTISGDTNLKPYKGTFLRFIREAGYRVAENKVAFCGRHQRQVVTGLLVNDRLRPAPKFIRELSILIKASYWPGGPGVEIMADAEGVSIEGLKTRIAGRIAHVRRFDPSKARRLQNLKFKKPAGFSV